MVSQCEWSGERSWVLVLTVLEDLSGRLCRGFGDFLAIWKSTGFTHQQNVLDSCNLSKGKEESGSFLCVLRFHFGVFT